MSDPLSKKQVEFISSSTKKWNIAHGPVRSGKTVGSLFAFLTACYSCPDSQIYMFDTIFFKKIIGVVKFLANTTPLRE